MGIALALIGLIAYLVGWVWVVIIAFRENLWWGLGVFFVPLVAIYFVITHWDEAKKAFITTVAGVVLFVAGAMATPSRPRPTIVQQPQQQQASIIPATTTHATFDSVVRQTPEPPSRPVQIEEPPQPVFAQVYADNKTKLYYPKDCANHPANAYLLAKSVAVSQGFKPAPPCS